MRESSIIRFLMALGVDYPTIEPARGYVNSPCPLAPYTHAGGADTRPSFGVKVNDEGSSYYYCFGCTPKGRGVQWLLHNIFIMSGRYPKEAAEIYAKEELHFHEDDVVIEPKDVWKKPEERGPQPLPYEVVNQYPLLQGGRPSREKRRCVEYLKDERLIDPQMASYYRVRHDPDETALVFPLTDRRGNMFVLRERSRKQKNIWTVSPKLAGFPNLRFPKLREVGVWFGLWLVDFRKPVLALETEMDVLRLASLGFFNAIASATSSVTDAQINTLLMARVVYSGFDMDKAGEHAHRRIVERAQERSVIYKLDWSLGERHPLFVKEGASACTDPGDLKDEAELQKVLQGKKRVNLLDK